MKTNKLGPAPKGVVKMAFTWEKFEFYNKYAHVAERRNDEPFLSYYHTHDFVQMIYCREGRFLHSINGVEKECREGTLSIVAPGVPHTFDSPKDCSLVYIDIPYNLFSMIRVGKFPSVAALCFLQNYKERLPFELCEFYDLGEKRAEAEEILLRAEELSKTKEDGIKVLELVESFLSLIFSPSKEDVVKIKKIYNARIAPVISAMEYMNAHYGNKISCDDLLCESLLCSSSFYDFFRSFFTCSYSNYLQMLRVSRAHRAVSLTTYSLSYISDMCGFGDRTYMSKCYKKLKGYTPTEERRRLNFKNQSLKHLKISHDFFDSPDEKK